MAPGHLGSLHVPGASPVHRLAPECKVLAHVGFVLAVVATPREAFWAFGVHALLLTAVAAAARLPVGIARRLAIETPFVAFALLLPFVGEGPRTEVLGIPLAVEGLWGAWNILAKATLGAAASILLTATTPVPDVIRGLRRLRVPAALVAVAGFMVRYLEVVGGEMRRMRVARISRGHDPRWLWQARAVASSIGALFIRSYERGERVYLAMASRGYAGTFPSTDDKAAAPHEWALAAALPMVAALLALGAWVR